MERLVPHRTRVIIDGDKAGVVVRVENAHRVTAVGGRRVVDLPAAVHVVLDDSSRICASIDRIEIERSAAA